MYKISVTIPTSSASLIVQSLDPDSELSDRVVRTLTAVPGSSPSSVSELRVNFEGSRAKDVRVAARSCMDDIKLLIRANDELSQL
jgi:hypothetical protein